MKKFVALLIFTAILSACSDTRYYGTCNRGAKPQPRPEQIAEPAPQYQPRYRQHLRPASVMEEETPVRIKTVYVKQPCACNQGCNCGCGCNNQKQSIGQNSVTETREPLEIIYKKTVTTKTYEPKVETVVSYEKEKVESQSTEVKTQTVTVTEPSEEVITVQINGEEIK